MSENIVLIEENEDKTITTIKMNRLDKKNALNYELFKGLEDAVDKVQQSNTRVVILTGSNDVFSAGIDLKMLTGQDKSSLNKMPNVMNPSNFRYWLNTWLQPILTKIERMEKPVIARIDGYCYGSGFELALACDFRFALEKAEFTMPESKVGIITDVGGTTRLTRLIGIMHAKDIILTGRKFDGNEAYRMGILTGVAKSPEELDILIKKYADELIDSAPLAVGMGKKLIDSCYGKDSALGMELEGLVNSQLLQSKDFMSGAAARVQKTKPKWKGK
ncbi:MAG: enoyl-CoA hydratase/isomerase family protein [Candidatus Lokiarchaeota archaeon]|nr:enoyl-CoA hydratase/isomerase family protein [Candidatus Lokiarchaeota archaeon]